jgi:Na+-transporting methylmalonyl-CoA/oxaloacetate decarboxylase gamma subunit
MNDFYLQIFMFFFLILCIISWIVIGAFIRRKDKDERDSGIPTPPPTPADDDESLVFRIW